MTDDITSSGRRGRAVPETSSELIGRGFDESPVVEQSDCSLSGKEPFELQDHADKGVSAGRLAVHLHYGGETGRGEIFGAEAETDRWRGHGWGRETCVDRCGGAGVETSEAHK